MVVSHSEDFLNAVCTDTIWLKPNPLNFAGVRIQGVPMLTVVKHSAGGSGSVVGTFGGDDVQSGRLKDVILASPHSRGSPHNSKAAGLHGPHHRRHQQGGPVNEVEHVAGVGVRWVEYSKLVSTFPR